MRPIGVLVGLVACTVVLAAGCGALGVGGDGQEPAPEVAVSGPARPADAQALTVRYVYDGDTLQLQAATPGRYVTDTAKVRVRLIGIDAPEMRPTPECFGPEATDRLRSLTPPGSSVWVAPDVDGWDKYGRRLFLVWTDDGRLVNLELVAGGFSEAIRVRPNVTYWPLLRDTARAAESARRGLWAACD